MAQTVELRVWIHPAYVAAASAWIQCMWVVGYVLGYDRAYPWAVSGCRWLIDRGIRTSAK